MFTGIITDIGTVHSIEARGDARFWIATRYDLATVDIGASIACDGVCLTVVDKRAGAFAVDVSAETMARSTLGRWAEGTPVNLERSVRVGDELGGHIVTGHVDAVGTILAITPEGDSRRFLLHAPAVLAAALAPKGSVAINGVSLTVNTVEDQADGSVLFGVNIIPHTLQWTSFGTVTEGRPVNLEMDVLARYIARLQAVRAH